MASRGWSAEPFNVPRVLFLIIGTLVIPSLCLSVLGALVLISADVRVTPYIILLVIATGSIGVGTALMVRAAWRGARLSRLKTDFVSHVSHELRTPLTSIRIFIETLQQGRARTDEERQACLDLLAKETERLTEMIERVLEWSRLESGRKILRAEPVEVSQLLAETVGVFETHHIGNPPPVRTVIPSGVPEVWADRGAAIDVLLNLLSNAVKYGGPDKEVRLAVAHQGRWVDIAVEDQGPGIGRGERKRIFDRFYRADDLLSRRTVGTGLGLSIAKRLAEGIGGRLRYHPGEEGGSRFVLRLPVASPRRQREDGAAEPKGVETAP